MSLSLLIESFIVTIIGGMGSIVGAFIAAVLIGLTRSFGSIINVASVAGSRSMPMHAKAAVIATMEGLAAEWGRCGVRVNGIGPAPCWRRGRPTRYAATGT